MPPASLRFGRRACSGSSRFRSNPHSLSANYIWTSLEDSRGNIWVGTFGGGLFRFDAESETFLQYMPDPADTTSLPHPYVFVIFEDSKGTFWIGTADGSMFLGGVTGPRSKERVRVRARL